MSNVVVMDAEDNVATAVSLLQPGDEISIDGETRVVNDEIQLGHKIALEGIDVGDPVVKYGLKIGTATEDIEAGEHVHVHNVESNYGRGDK